MAVSQIFRQIQLLFVSVNYGLVCWLIIRLKEEDHLGLFIFLLVILSIERILILLKSIFVLVFGIQYCAIPLSILMTILCLDLSLGYDLDDDDLYFFHNQFSRQINYTVHYVNLVPIIICFQVSDIRQEISSFSHPVYWILIIYGLVHVSASELIIILEKGICKINQLYNIWRFIEGICRFGCFCACAGELLSVSLWYLWLMVLLVSFEILIRVFKQKSCYFFFTFFQIQLISGYESVSNKHKYAEFHLITNAFQTVFLGLLFILRTSIHPELRTYDILLYAAFAILIPQGFSSIYYLIKYILFGPFSQVFNLKQHGINPEQQISNLLMDQQKILKVTENKILINYLSIYIGDFDEQIFSKKQILLFDFEIIKTIANRRGHLRNCNVSRRYIEEFNIRQNCVEFNFTDPFDLEKAVDIITFILDSELLQKSKMKFILDASSMTKYELTRIFLQKTYFANPTIFKIIPQLQVDLHNKLFLDILKFIANSMMIFPFLPINPSAYMFDLYEDYLQMKDF